MTAPRFSIIPAQACTDTRLKPRDLQVLCLFGRHTSNNGWCRRSQVKMAAELGCARSTVQAAINNLVQHGYMDVRQFKTPHEKGERDSAHEYRVKLDLPDVEEAEGFATKSAPTPAGISAPPADPGPAPPADPEPAPINDYCLTPPVREDSPLTPQGGDGLFDLFWNAFSEGQRGSSRRAVEARFHRAVKVHPGLSDQIIDAVKLYRLHCYARSVPACAERFLRRKTFETYIDTPPEFDKGGDWIITPDRPEWGPWIGFQRDNHGDARIGQIARIGRMLVKTRWPDGYPKQQEQAA